VAVEVRAARPADSPWIDEFLAQNFSAGIPLRDEIELGQTL
jgi:hypothetical protein